MAKSDTRSSGSKLSWIYTVSSAALMVCTFPFLSISWLAWICLVPFLLTFPHRSTRDAFWHGLLFGFVAYGGIMYWLIPFAKGVLGLPLGVLVWVITAAAQGLAAAFFSIAYQWMCRRGFFVILLGPASAWTLFEWIRQLGSLGVAWGDLGYTQQAPNPHSELAKLGGVWLITFAIVSVNSSIAAAMSRKPKVAFACAGAFVVGLSWTYGKWVLRNEVLRPAFTASALQTNLNIDVPWHGNRPGDMLYVAHAMGLLQNQMAEASAHGSSLAVTSETDFPGYLRTDSVLRQQVAGYCKQYHTALLVGGYDLDARTRRDINSMFLMTKEGTIEGEYQKRHLVPYGEVVPGRQWLPFLSSFHLTTYDREAGPNVQPLMDTHDASGKLGAVVCYESSYPDLLTEQTRRGAGLIVMGSDDTWFGKTAAARQHADMASTRAVENDRYLIRCAATGISEVIDPVGTVIASAPLFQQRVVSAQVESRHTSTTYVRFGNWIVWASAFVLVTLALGSFSRGARP